MAIWEGVNVLLMDKPVWLPWQLFVVINENWLRFWIFLVCISRFILL